MRALELIMDFSKAARSTYKNQLNFSTLAMNTQKLTSKIPLLMASENGKYRKMRCKTHTLKTTEDC